MLRAQNIAGIPKRHFSRRTTAFELSPIKEMELRASKMPGVISLAQGIPYLETPKEVTRFVQEKIVAGLCDKYSLSPGLEELREELSLSLDADGQYYNPEREILVTAGSIQGMTATLLTLVQKGDEVLIPSPTYASYIGSVHLAEATPKYVPLEEDSGFDISVEAFERAVTPRTKALLLCIPNNPTGTVFSAQTLEGLLRLAVQHNLYVIVDEVYKDFYFSEDPHVSPADYPWARDRIVRVCSFSKAYAMTGWRVGFLAAPEDIIAQILKVHDVMVSCAPVASQYGAIAALRYGEATRLRYIEEFRARRDLTVSYLDQISEWVDYQVPKATYFAFPRIKDTVPLARDSRRLVYDILEKAHVACVEGVAFGPSGESHLRINFGRSESDVREGMSRIGEYFQKGTAKNHTAQSIQDGTSTRPTTQQRFLRWLTRLSLRNQLPCTIGIVGVRGKTVVRRKISEKLQKHSPLLSSSLSYNTITGLCFSLLNIKPPKNTLEKIRAAFLAIFRSLFIKRSERLFVLEYGVARPSEVNDYLSIVHPDYIVVTSGIGFDPNIRNTEVLDALQLLCKRANPKKVLLPEDERWLKEYLELTDEQCTTVSPLPEKSCGRSDAYGQAFAAELSAMLS